MLRSSLLVIALRFLDPTIPPPRPEVVPASPQVEEAYELFREDHSSFNNHFAVASVPLRIRREYETCVTEQGMIPYSSNKKNYPHELAPNGATSAITRDCDAWDGIIPEYLESLVRELGRQGKLPQILNGAIGDLDGNGWQNLRSPLTGVRDHHIDGGVRYPSSLNVLFTGSLRGVDTNKTGTILGVNHRGDCGGTRPRPKCLSLSDASQSCERLFPMKKGDVFIFLEANAYVNNGEKYKQLVEQGKLCDDTDFLSHMGGTTPLDDGTVPQRWTYHMHFPIEDTTWPKQQLKLNEWYTSE